MEYGPKLRSYYIKYRIFNNGIYYDCSTIDPGVNLLAAIEKFKRDHDFEYDIISISEV